MFGSFVHQQSMPLNVGTRIARGCLKLAMLKVYEVDKVGILLQRMA
jgi:hypothetical protein